MKREIHIGIYYIIGVIAVTVLFLNNTTQLIESYGINLTSNEINVIGLLALIGVAYYAAFKP